ncbi:hypothetical protein E2C01_012204 [Portunus trituberculatus]|uniref:Uncharacterized protein n=1 Tax=Portunus trituberculatus TaxID=210409 RepID=A0A5B7DDE3_PORTR|nr:hypothetical protein [Portunus trituberculatus]
MTPELYEIYYTLSGLLVPLLLLLCSSATKTSKRFGQVLQTHVSIKIIFESSSIRTVGTLERSRSCMGQHVTLEVVFRTNCGGHSVCECSDYSFEQICKGKNGTQKVFPRSNNGIPFLCDRVTVVLASEQRTQGEPDRHLRCMQESLSLHVACYWRALTSPFPRREEGNLMRV